ncbi:putative monooxygenase [Thozetella sp. PMI_491]|nr:putative monooxygenase [Thozetella sp. PMI_491]
MSAATPPRVAVVGAGLTGLLVAQGLKKHGFDVNIYDRDLGLDSRRRDWTILIHWAMPLLQEMLPDDVLAKMPEAICNPHLEFTLEVETLPIFNGATGEVLFRSPTPGARRVTRQKMRRVLAHGLDIHWGKALSALAPRDTGMTLTFEDGETVVADYVLGADGANSKVRELLLGTEAATPTLAGLMFATGITSYGDADKVKHITEANPVASIFMGVGASGGIGVMDVEDHPEDPSRWTTFWAYIWPGPMADLQGQEAIDFVKEHSKRLCEPFKSAIDWTPDDSRCYVDQMKYWVPVPYPTHGGKVTLAGDAGHPMLPFRGQGLQHAIDDASKYVAALRKIRDIDDAAAKESILAEYDAEMVPRGATAVKQSVLEASNSFDEETLNKMIMIRQGHGKST